MKNGLDRQDSLIDQFPTFPAESRVKLAAHLKGYPVDLSRITQQDLDLFRLAYERLRNNSLKEMCRKIEQELSQQRSSHWLNNLQHIHERRRTASEGLAESLRVDQDVHKCLRSVGSLDLEEDHEDEPKQTYFLMIGKNKNNKTIAIVYNILSRKIYQKEIPVKSGKTVSGICGVDLHEAPYLFLLLSKGSNLKMKRYDVIKDKWRKCAKLNKTDPDPLMVGLFDSIFLFGSSSTDVKRYSLAQDKWSNFSELKHKIQKPAVTRHNGKLYIFEGNILQILEPFKGSVTVVEVSSFILTGFAFSWLSHIIVMSESSMLSYNVETTTQVRDTFSSLNYCPLHFVFVGFGKVFALVTDKKGQFDIRSTTDLSHWKREITFPKSIEIDLAGTVNYLHKCPIGPFESYEESLRKSTFARTS